MFKVGDQVRIKQNAFPESDAPADIAVRGKVGTIIGNSGEPPDNLWDVEVEDVVGLFPFPVLESEIELVAP